MSFAHRVHGRPASTVDPGPVHQPGEPPSEEAVEAAEHAAEQRWWDAYNGYILDGEDEVVSMLNDGPTDAHLATLGDAGVIPPAPPGGINGLNWAGHVMNGFNGGLSAYIAWRGSPTYAGVRNRPNLGNLHYWQGQHGIHTGDARYHQSRMPRWMG